MDYKPENPVSEIEIESKLDHQINKEDNKYENKYEQIFIEEDEFEGRSTFSIGKLIVGIIVLLIILEIIFLGLRYYMPENKYIQIVNSRVNQAVATVEKWF